MAIILAWWAVACAVAVCLILIFGLGVEYTWNSCLVPAVDGVNPITFYQAMGLMFLVAWLSCLNRGWSRKKE